jgi:hypothetical protein
MDDIIKIALAIAKTGLPVFPTRNKKPALSNRDLAEALGHEIKRGMGGFKMASTKPAVIKKIFAAANAVEIAVPCGPVAKGGGGIIVIDCDTYKSEEATQWVEDHLHLLDITRMHCTRSGGEHYIFSWPDDLHVHPSTLAPGIDLKGLGGYICWPGTPGYTVVHEGPIQPFPMALLNNLKQSNTLSDGTPTAWNEATDAELIAAVQSAEELYPALRTLAWRMRQIGSGINAEQAVSALQNIMDSSAAAFPWHPRHEDWADRYDKIQDLVDSAGDKQTHPMGQASAMTLEGLDDGESFIDPQSVLTKHTAPAPKPPREPMVLEPFKVEEETLPAREWLYGHHMIRGFLTATVAPGGMGKSSLIIVEALSMVTQKPLLGVTVYEPLKVLYWCGEDPKDELDRRFSAAMDHYGLTQSDLGERLYVVSGRDMGLKLAYHERQDAKLNDEDIAALTNLITELEIDLVIIDPMASIHSINENSNNEMTDLLDALREIADKTRCGIEIVHHSTKEARKGGAAMGAEQARGASAITDAARSVRALSKMTKADREEAGLSEEEANQIALVRSVKGNMSPGERSSAIRLISVDLNNPTPTYPLGDTVGVVEPVTIDRTARSDWTESVISQLACLNLIQAAPEPWRKSSQAEGWAGNAILKLTKQDDEATAKRFAGAMLERLEEDGYLIITTSKTQRGREVESYMIDEEKMAEISQSLN